MRKDFYRQNRPGFIPGRDCGGLSLLKGNRCALSDSILIAGFEVPVIVGFRSLLLPVLCFLICSIIPLSSALADVSNDDWCFEPLGPDGADVTDLQILDESGCFIRTTRGNLLFWEESSGSFADGLWREVATNLAGELFLTVAEPSAYSAPVILTTRGELFRWVRDEAEGDHPDKAGTTSFGSGGLDLSTGAWVTLGRLMPDVASNVMAMVSAGERDREQLLIFTRDGQVISVTDGELERWELEFWVRDGANFSVHDAFGVDARVRINNVILHPADPDLLILQTEWEGLFYSRDGARTFYSVEGDLPKAVRAVGQSENGFYAACIEGLYYSDDFAGSWSLVEANPTNQKSLVGTFTQLCVDPQFNDHLFAITGAGRLYESYDAGQTWDLRLSDIPVRLRRLAWQSDGSGVIAATSRGILFSSDRGQRWQWRNRGLRQISVLAMATNNANGDLYLGTDIGFYAGLAEGYEWSTSIITDENESNYIPENRIRTNERSGSDHITDTGMISSLTEKSWSRLSGNISAVSISPEAGLVDKIEDHLRPQMPAAIIPWLCVGTKTGPVCGGIMSASETGEETTVWFDFGRVSLTTSVLMLPDGEAWAAGAGGGQAWLGYSLAEMQTMGESSVIDRDGASIDLLGAEGFGCRSWHDRDLDSASPPEIVGNATDESTPLAVSGRELWALSRTGGETIHLPAGSEAICVCSSEQGLWLGTDNGLFFQMHDSEDRWLPVAFSGSRIIKIKQAASGHKLLVQSSDGVFWSGDGGRNWARVPVDSQHDILSLALAPDGRRIYFGTRSGVLATDPPEPGLTIQPLLPIEPVPNPFNEMVSLRCALITSRPVFAEFGQSQSGFSISASGGEPVLPESGVTDQVMVQIYGVNGQLVCSLSEAEVISSGGDRFLQWHWDGRNEHGQDAPNGIYWAATRIGKQEYTGKIVKFR